MPTLNSDILDKCEEAINQYEQKQLLDTYAQQLCQNPGHVSVNRMQLGEIQMRLRKFSLTFPQSNIKAASTDIDGLFGAKTCEMIANYQIVTKSDVVDGIAGISLYNDLMSTIPLNEVELASLNLDLSAHATTVVKAQGSRTSQNSSKPSFKLPKDPSKRKAFCLRNKHIKQCKHPRRIFDLAKNEIESEKIK